MITREEVLTQIRTVIEENVQDMFGTDLQEDTVLNAEGNVDSMGFILVVTKLEGIYNVKIPDEEWYEIRTLGDLADVILKYMPEQ